MAGVGVVDLGVPVVHRDRDEDWALRRQRRRGGCRGPGPAARPRRGPARSDHLTSGCGIRIASRLVRFACSVICARACWPAVTRTGEWLAWALKIAPIALPTPGAVWRLAIEACPTPARSRRPCRRRPPPAGRAHSGSRPGSRRASAARSSPGCRTSSSSRAHGRGRSWPREPMASRAPYLAGSRAGPARRLGVEAGNVPRRLWPPSFSRRRQGWTSAVWAPTHVHG